MEAVLHIKLILPREKEFHCIVRIRGKGNIPRIAITKPDEYDPVENKYNMNLGGSVLGFPMLNFFTIKNVGSVFARVCHFKIGANFITKKPLKFHNMEL